MPTVPRNLLAAAQEEGRTDWLAGLPAIIGDLTRRWSVEIGAPFEPGGQTAWVAPAQDAQGRSLVVKIGWPHPEAADEATGLAAWAGRGAVLLHAVEVLADATAMLLERCVPGVALSTRPEPEQDSVVADLLLRLWIPPPDSLRFRPLADMCAQWAHTFEARGGATALDPGLARDGIALFRQLPLSAERTVLLCTDLHAGNILAAEREPWLAIDPKPYIGDPTYDVLQHMLNCAERLHADPLRFTRQMADLVGVDAERLRLWLFARCVQESAEYPQLAEVATAVAPRDGSGFT
jgi:streptomycin 6-kinase